MGPFTRVDARDLALAGVCGTVGALVMMALGMTDDPVFNGITFTALGFLLSATAEMDPELKQRLGDRRAAGRFHRAIRTGEVPTDVDRALWLDVLDAWPDLSLYRRRITWVLGLCALGLAVSVVAAIVWLATDSDIARSILRSTLPPAGGIGVMAFFFRILPWPANAGDKLRRSLEATS